MLPVARKPDAEAQCLTVPKSFLDRPNWVRPATYLHDHKLAQFEPPGIAEAAPQDIFGD